MNRPYKYKHLEHLNNTDIANASIQSCNIFAYNVNSNCMIPFLKYLFVRGSDEQQQTLHLPSIEIC